MLSSSAILPPSYPARPMVSMPRRLASSNARTRLAEFPLVDRPTAMSFRPPKAASWRAKTTSTPMSLHSAVTTDVSLARPNAGNGGTPGPGSRNMVASCWASVALPPLPKANSRPPAAKRAAASAAHRASRAPSRAPTVCRSAVISAILATLEARTCSRTAVMSVVPAYRNGYSDSTPPAPVVSSCRPTGSSPHDGDGFLGVHENCVAHLSLHQGDADFLLALPSIDHGEAIGQQADDRDLDGRVGAGDADVTVALGHDRGGRGAPPGGSGPGSGRPGAGCGHTTTSGPSTPGCSKNTCTSSHSRWYMVTWSSLTIRGSADGAVRR